MSRLNARVLEFLQAERDGVHGESERRYAAEWAIDAQEMLQDGTSDMPPEAALDHLARSVTDLAARLRKFRAGLSPKRRKG